MAYDSSKCILNRCYYSYRYNPSSPQTGPATWRLSCAWSPCWLRYGASLDESIVVNMGTSRNTLTLASRVRYCQAAEKTIYQYQIDIICSILKIAHSTAQQVYFHSSTSYPDTIQVWEGRVYLALSRRSSVGEKILIIHTCISGQFCYCYADCWDYNLSYFPVLSFYIFYPQDFMLHNECRFRKFDHFCLNKQDRENL